MNIEIKEVEGASVIIAEGALDTNTAPELEQEMTKLLEQGAKKIVVSGEKMDFISSTGLRILLATAQKLKNNNGELKICSLNEDVKEVFEISGFSSILMVYKDQNEALQSF